MPKHLQIRIKCHDDLGLTGQGWFAELYDTRHNVIALNGDYCSSPETALHRLLCLYKETWPLGTLLPDPEDYD